MILRGPNDTKDSMMKQFQDLHDQGRLAQHEGKTVAGCSEVDPRSYFEWRWSESIEWLASFRRPNHWDWDDDEEEEEEEEGDEEGDEEEEEGYEG